MPPVGREVHDQQHAHDLQPQRPAGGPQRREPKRLPGGARQRQVHEGRERHPHGDGRQVVEDDQVQGAGAAACERSVRNEHLQDPQQHDDDGQEHERAQERVGEASQQREPGRHAAGDDERRRRRGTQAAKPVSARGGEHGVRQRLRVRGHWLELRGRLHSPLTPVDEHLYTSFSAPHNAPSVD